MGDCWPIVFGSSTSNDDQHSSGGSQFPVSICDGQVLAAPDLRIFSFKELKTATQNFKPCNVVGEGRFGTMFKGVLHDNRQQPSCCSYTYRGSHTPDVNVAIKKLEPGYYEQHSEEWKTETEFYGRLSHPNLVRLLGYCCDDSRRLLVCEYVQRGSLKNHLFGRGSAVHPLPWGLRIKIAVGAARAFTFLHASDDRVVIRDIKPDKFLLDEVYNVKISYFGLTILSPGTEIKTERTCILLRLSDGYIAPEYLSTELLTGFRLNDVCHLSETPTLKDWIKRYLWNPEGLISTMDPKLGDYPFRAAVMTVELAHDCLDGYPKIRSSMKQVLDTLERIQAIH